MFTIKSIKSISMGRGALCKGIGSARLVDDPFQYEARLRVSGGVFHLTAYVTRPRVDARISHE